MGATVIQVTEINERDIATTAGGIPAAAKQTVTIGAKDVANIEAYTYTNVFTQPVGAKITLTGHGIQGSNEMFVEETEAALLTALNANVIAT